MYDLIIIGGGIIGLSTIYKILESQPNIKILLIEKELKLAQHQTGNNSGVGLSLNPVTQLLLSF